jgi:glutamate synthase (NADPH) large chain
MIDKFVKVMPQDFKKALASRNINFADVLNDKSIVYKDIQIELTH